MFEQTKIWPFPFWGHSEEISACHLKPKFSNDTSKTSTCESSVCDSPRLKRSLFGNDREKSGPLRAPQPAECRDDSPGRVSSRSFSTRKKARRRVSFQLEADDSVSVEVLGPLLVPSSEMKKSERRRIWYKKQEILQNIQDALAQADLLDESALLAAYTKCSSGSVGQMVDDDRKNIEVWALDQWRGLERFVIPALNKQRMHTRAASVKGVLNVQRIIKMDTTKKDRAEYLRNVSLHLTHSARQFALLMGEADAKAASLQQEQDDEELDTEEESAEAIDPPSDIEAIASREAEDSIVKRSGLLSKLVCRPRSMIRN